MSKAFSNAPRERRHLSESVEAYMDIGGALVRNLRKLVRPRLFALGETRLVDKFVKGVL
jgi:hypothetical protein